MPISIEELNELVRKDEIRFGETILSVLKENNKPMTEYEICIKILTIDEIDISNKYKAKIEEILRTAETEKELTSISEIIDFYRILYQNYDYIHEKTNTVLKKLCLEGKTNSEVVPMSEGHKYFEVQYYIVGDE